MHTQIINQAVLERIKKIPIFDTLGFELLELNEGICKAKVKHEKKYDGIFNSFHGGLLITIADSITSFAILSKIGAEAIIATTDMNIRFLSPCLSDVYAEATIIKLGKTLIPVAIDLFDEKKKKVAVAQVTYIRIG